MNFEEEKEYRDKVRFFKFPNDIQALLAIMIGMVAYNENHGAWTRNDLDNEIKKYIETHATQGPYSILPEVEKEVANLTVTEAAKKLDLPRKIVRKAFYNKIIPGLIVNSCIKLFESQLYKLKEITL